MNATIDEIILLAGGAFLAVLGIGKMAERSKLLKTGIRVEGRVMRNDNDAGGTDGGTYYPVIRYVTLDKEWVTKKYDIGSSPPVFKEGDAVKVIYRPDNHQQFTIDNWHSRLLGPLLLITGTVLITGVAVFYIFNQY